MSFVKGRLKKFLNKGAIKLIEVIERFYLPDSTLRRKYGEAIEHGHWQKSIPDEDLNKGEPEEGRREKRRTREPTSHAGGDAHPGRRPTRTAEREHR